VVLWVVRGLVFRAPHVALHPLVLFLVPIGLFVSVSLDPSDGVASRVAGKDYVKVSQSGHAHGTRTSMHRCCSPCTLFARLCHWQSGTQHTFGMYSTHSP
jgi:hypothetical protein